MPQDDPQLEAKILDFWYATIRLEQAAKGCADLFQSIVMPEAALDRVYERATYLHALGGNAEIAREAVSKYIGPNRTHHFVEIPQKEEEENE